MGYVGYIEAEFFGGFGSQRAALWVDQMLAVGPLSVEEGAPFAETGSPISQLLRHLDVTPTGHYDEFDAVGLDRHRHTAEWLA
jgi:hypothetical protein